jgi:hypothetical protein
VLSLATITSGLKLNSHIDTPHKTVGVNDLIDEEVRRISSVWSFKSFNSLSPSMQLSEISDKPLRVASSDGTDRLTCTPECKGDVSDIVEPFYRYRDEKPLQVPFFEVSEKTNFWSSSSTKECLRGKTVLFLGDSTMTESVEDLLLLLTGDVANVSAFAESVTTVTGQKHMTWSSHLGEVHANFLHTHRNLTITMPDDKIVLKHRFMGHVDLNDNMMGVTTFLDESVKSEIQGYLSALRPDVIVVNSGLHNENATYFEQYFPQVARENVMPWLDAGIRVVWKSNMFYSSWGNENDMVKMNLLAKDTLAGTGVEWVSVNDALDALQQFSDITFQDTPHFPHIGMIAKYHDAQASIFPSQFLTFKLLDAICKTA